MTVSCRRVILMAWRAPGKSRRLRWAAFRVRVSARPCPVSRAESPAYLPPGQRLDLGVQQRLVALDDSDVMGFLVLDQPVQVRPHRVESVEGHNGAVQVRRLQQLGEMAGLVVLDVDLEVVQEVAAVSGDAEQVDPGAVGTAGSAGGLAVHGHGPQPAAGQRFLLLDDVPGTVVAHGGRRRPARASAAARARPEQSPGQGPRVKTVQHHPDRLLIRRTVPAGERIPRRAQPGQVRLPRPPDPLPDRGEPVVPGGSKRADRDRDQAGQRVDPPLR